MDPCSSPYIIPNIVPIIHSHSVLSTRQKRMWERGDEGRWQAGLWRWLKVHGLNLMDPTPIQLRCFR